MNHCLRTLLKMNMAIPLVSRKNSFPLKVFHLLLKKIIYCVCFAFHSEIL